MLAAFDAEQSRLAVVTPDSVVRVYDVSRRRLVSECRAQDHLTARYSCIAWGPRGSSSSASSAASSAAAAQQPRRKRKATSSSAATDGGALLAVGGAGGNVAVWDPATAEQTALLRPRSSGARAAVAAVAWHPSSPSLSSEEAEERRQQTVLLACAEDGAVTAWNVASALPVARVRAGHEASAMLALPPVAAAAAATTAQQQQLPALLVTAALSLRVRPLSSAIPDAAAAAAEQQGASAAAQQQQQQHVRKLAASHAAPIAQIVAVRGPTERLLGARRIVLTCSATERQIYAWDVGSSTAPAGAKAASAPLQGFAAEAVPVAMDALVFEDPRQQRPAVAVLAVTAAGTVDVWLWDIAQPSATTAATAAKGRTRMLEPAVRITSRGAPAFCAQFASPTRVLVAHGQPTVLPRFDTVDVFNAEDCKPLAASIALPEDAAKPAEQQGGRAKAAKQPPKLAPHEAGALPRMKVASKDDDDDDDDDAKAEDEEGASLQGTTLGERLAAEETGSTMVTTATAAAAGGIRANSMHTALMQAVRTNDQSLMDSCLQAQEPDIVTNTVRRLPSQYVVPFLVAVVDRMQSNPARGLALVQWIRALLAEHMAYLMTIPRVDTALSGLYLMVHSRLETHRAFLKLSGRLDLVLAQVARAQQQGTDATPALNVITEGDDGEPVAVEALPALAEDSDMEDEEVQGGIDDEEEEEDEEDEGEDEEEEEDIDAEDGDDFGDEDDDDLMQ